MDRYVASTDPIAAADENLQLQGLVFTKHDRRRERQLINSRDADACGRV
jgi:hypothetical protein